MLSALAYLNAEASTRQFPPRNSTRVPETINFQTFARTWPFYIARAGGRGTDGPPPVRTNRRGPNCATQSALAHCQGDFLICTALLNNGGKRQRGIGHKEDFLESGLRTDALLPAALEP